MKDLPYESIQSGALVYWEEIARDGAQAKTLLTGSQRVELARAQGALFGEHGRNHLIFSAGFPAVCQEEFDAVRQVATEVENCNIASHGRTTREDVDLNLKVFQGVPGGRVSLFIPVSNRMSAVLLKQPAGKTLCDKIQVIRYALDRADSVSIDIALVDALRADGEFVIDAANMLFEEGIKLIKCCDTVGSSLPAHCYRFFKEVVKQTSPELGIGAHLHNDLGLGLANNLEAIRAGARVVAGSWLGLAERTGLAATEQLLFLLSHPRESLVEQLGFEGVFWRTPPDLKGLVPLARRVSRMTGVPLKVTDPIVGQGVNSLSTGTPFVDPTTFQPFDAESVLGVPRQVVLTQLASRRVIRTVAEKLGFSLDEEGLRTALKWVKTQAYQQGAAQVSEDQFAAFLEVLAVRDSCSG